MSTSNSIKFAVFAQRICDRDKKVPFLNVDNALEDCLIRPREIVGGYCEIAAAVHEARQDNVLACLSHQIFARAHDRQTVFFRKKLSTDCMSIKRTPERAPFCLMTTLLMRPAAISS